MRSSAMKDFVVLPILWHSNNFQVMWYVIWSWATVVADKLLMQITVSRHSGQWPVICTSSLSVVTVVQVQIIYVCIFSWTMQSLGRFQLNWTMKH